jgi:opacity protein-like surface antigen
MISAKIPVNLVYSFQVSDNFRIEPYAGIYGRINIWGQEKVGDESANILSSDDFGDAACKRFQLGWNAGVQFRITEAFTIGAGYFMDLMKLQNYSSGKHDIKTNFQGFDFTLGINL